VRLGVFVEGYVPKGTTTAQRLKQMIGQAVLAEEVGLHSFGMSEQHFKFHTNSTPQPDVLMSAIAQETSVIRLALEVVVLPLHHPLHVAERIATLDVVSDGRVDFGVGRGNTSATADAFGIPVADSEERSIETLEIVLKAWQGEPFAYQGKHYSFGSLSLTPLPVQKPTPPVFWAAISPGSHERGGAFGYKLLTGGNAIDWTQLDRRVARYIQGWESRGVDDPHDIVRLNVHGFCAPTDKEANDIYAPYVVEYVNRTVKQYKLAVERSGQQVDFSASERFIDNYDVVLNETPVAIGDPDTCIAQLKRMADMGVDEVTLRLDGPSDDELRRCITLLGTEVAPAVAEFGRGVREVAPVGFAQ
jgi:alkanesulfonate monooxygenase SsuD/methylene tetrahydromethanopterin reductase-like flavin-dependent oxidoreductase (luciferase family)